MTLNASGPISIAGTTAGQSIQIELNGNGTTQMSLNCTNVRTLAGVPSGAIIMPTNFYGKSNAAPFGCATYGTAGTYTFTVPTGITKICVVCVGGGMGGASGGCCDDCIGGRGGGGGYLAYTNCIPVTAGESLTVVAGAGGPKSCIIGGTGNPSYISRGATVLVRATGGTLTTGTCISVGAVKYKGGLAQSCALHEGDGSGGAAGYAGNGGTGGNGGITPTTPATAGSGGGGGGSGYSNTCAGSAGGGGVGLVVQGPSGAAGNNRPTFATTMTGGGGGSGGATAATVPGNTTPGTIGGAYGGGGAFGGFVRYQDYATPGANGGVRIIYGGTGKSYPSNSAP